MVAVFSPAARHWRRRRLSWGKALAALSASLILFDSTLSLGLGLDWALMGMLGLPWEAGALAAAPVFLGSLALAYWFFRRVYAAEGDLDGIPSPEGPEATGP